MKLSDLKFDQRIVEPIIISIIDCSYVVASPFGFIHGNIIESDCFDGFKQFLLTPDVDLSLVACEDCGAPCMVMEMSSFGRPEGGGVDPPDCESLVIIHAPEGATFVQSTNCLNESDKPNPEP
jgi:hypothetical protein